MNLMCVSQSLNTSVIVPLRSGHAVESGEVRVQRLLRVRTELTPVLSSFSSLPSLPLSKAHQLMHVTSH